MVNYRAIIQINSEIRSGKPCVRNTRISVFDVLNWLANGMTFDEIIDDFPEIIGGFVPNKGEIFFINGEEVIFPENQIQINRKGSILNKVFKSGQYTIKITWDEKLTTGAYSEGKISLFNNNELVFNSHLIISGF